MTSQQLGTLAVRDSVFCHTLVSLEEALLAFGLDPSLRLEDSLVSSDSKP